MILTPVRFGNRIPASLPLPGPGDPEMVWPFRLSMIPSASTMTPSPAQGPMSAVRVVDLVMTVPQASLPDRIAAMEACRPVGSVAGRSPPCWEGGSGAAVATSALASAPVRATHAIAVRTMFQRRR